MARVTASRAICWIAWATPLLACRGPSIPGVDDELGSSGSDSESSSDSETGEEPFDPLICGSWNPPAATPATTPPAQQPCPDALCPIFTEVAAEAGLATQQYIPTHPADLACIFPRPTESGLSPHLDCEPQWFTGGVSVGDVDDDGWPDVYMTRLAAPDHLFRNRGDGTFVDIAAEVGLDLCSYSSGSNFADIDNDGDLDLLVTGKGETHHWLWINQLVETGELAFVDEAELRGFALSSSLPHGGESVTLGDYDRDGWLDIHVNEWLRVEQAPLPADPDFPVHRARLLHNLGALGEAGGFEDLTEAMGVDLWGLDLDGTFAFSSTFADLDGDGWQDLAIAVDFHRSRIFWNMGPGMPFYDGSNEAHVNLETNAMGSTFADVDGDGWLDWYVTAISEPDTCDEGETPPCWSGSGNRLYRYIGDRDYELRQDQLGVRIGYWAWGTTFFDLDNDGDQDLTVANGWPGRDLHGGFYHQETAMRLWINQGEVMSEEGAARGVADTGQGRGVVSFDYDRDGDLDLLVANHAGSPRLFRNDGGNRNPWLQVEVEGTVSNRDGRGAKVRIQVVDGGPWQVREVGVGSHFLGEGELGQHFGLGADFDPAVDRIHRVEVEWPVSGAIVSLDQVQAEQRLLVVEP
ncbi:MAG: CRTAC1 family protein [Myxococcales bacterium]|nr:CRTAC1 family protein [Myxococcales bacterium]